MRDRTWKFIGLGLAVAFFTYRLSPQLDVLRGGSVGDEMPAFAVKTLDEVPITRDSALGKVVLVNFWASWCGPCVTEMPAFDRVYHAKKDQGFVVLGIWTNDTDPFAMYDFLREHAIRYPIIVGAEELVESFGGVWALPVSILIDRNGKIVKRVTGIFAEEALRTEVERLLSESARAPVQTGR
ncbi:MAG: TlpA disulfide reductase family protein [Gemmatimonadota bacterium]